MQELSQMTDTHKGHFASRSALDTNYQEFSKCPTLWCRTLTALEMMKDRSQEIQIRTRDRSPGLSIMPTLHQRSHSDMRFPVIISRTYQSYRSSNDTQDDKECENQLTAIIHSICAYNQKN